MPSAYFRAMETAAADHDEIVVEARGVHVAKANDTAQGFCDKYTSWTITSRVLGSIKYQDRNVTEATIRLQRTEE